jgi:hypothetical protein
MHALLSVQPHRRQARTLAFGRVEHSWAPKTSDPHKGQMTLNVDTILHAPEIVTLQPFFSRSALS